MTLTLTALPGSLNPGETILSGPLLAAMLVAAIAGLLSCASPCVLPLLPGYIGYVTGLSAGRPEARTRVAVLGATLFVLGFTAVFVAGLNAAAYVGDLLAARQPTLMRLGGVLVIAMGVMFMGVGTQRAWQVRWRPRTGLAGAPLLGVVFATGWAPCTGPTLAAVLTLATGTQDQAVLVRGTSLALAYSLGLGTPFVIFAAGLTRTRRLTRWITAHHRGMQLVGGGVLVVVGVLMASGLWVDMTASLQTRLVSGFTTVL